MPLVKEEYIEKSMQEAEKLLAEGAAERAVTIFRNILQSSGYSRKISQDILFVFVQAELYEEALLVHTEYKRLTGQDLPSDFTSEDIARWRDDRARTEEKYSGQEILVFKRRTGPKADLLQKIKEIRITDHQIEFVYSRGFEKHPWSSLKEAFITSKPTPRGPYSETRDHIVFDFGKDKYRIRTDPVFEDLEDTRVFLEQVRKRCQLGSRKERGYVPVLVIFLATIIFIIYLIIKLNP